VPRHHISEERSPHLHRSENLKTRSNSNFSSACAHTPRREDPLNTPHDTCFHAVPTYSWNISPHSVRPCRISPYSLGENSGGPQRRSRGGHTFRSLPYNRSIVPSKASSPHSPISASSFNLQYPLVSLRSFNSCLRLLPRLPVTSVLLSYFQ
jgi:hypothetical protein